MFARKFLWSRDVRSLRQTELVSLVRTHLICQLLLRRVTQFCKCEDHQETRQSLDAFSALYSSSTMIYEYRLWSLRSRMLPVNAQRKRSFICMNCFSAFNFIGDRSYFWPSPWLVPFYEVDKQAWRVCWRVTHFRIITLLGWSHLWLANK